MANTINKQQLIADLIDKGFERDRRFWHNGWLVFNKITDGHISEIWEINEDENIAWYYEHGHPSFFAPVEYKIA